MRSRARAETVSGSKAGRDAQAFLGAAVGDVDVPVIDRDLDPPQRGHHVHQEQCVPLGRPEGRNVVAHARRRLGVHDGDDGGVRMGGEEGLGLDRPPPGRVDAHHLRPRPVRHFTHPFAEDAVHPDHDRVARSHEVHERGFHARRAGAAQGQGQGVRGGENLPEALVGGVEKGQEFGVEVPEDRPRQGLGHLRVRIGGTRAHQQAVGNRHRRIVADPCSPAPTRPRQFALPVDCPGGTGSLCAPGPPRPPPRCRTRPGPLRRLGAAS